MQKTYLWRWGALAISLILIGISFIFSNQLLFGICDNVYTSGSYQGCLDNASKTIGEPLFLLSLSLLVVSFFLFFFSDKFFIKWFRFALIWFFLAIVFVALTPEQHNFMSLNPDKEIVSIWMSVLFVIISLGMFIREWMIAKK